MAKLLNRKHLYAVILAGGGGTRLWPKSRNKQSKQFLKLGGEKTLLQDTLDRVIPLVDLDHIIIVTNITQLRDVRTQVPHIPAQNIICEPEKRETAMAMAVGSLVAYAKDPDAVVMNFASDHTLTDHEEFHRVMTAVAETAADMKHLVAVGIAPTFPHTGLGHIHRGKKLKMVHGLPLYEVKQFVEKPNIERAQEFMRTGEYYWNANMYTWSVKAMLAAFQKHMPKMYETFADMKKAVGTGAFPVALEKAYENVEAISIDYAISEKADNLLLIPGNFGWNDIGDWKIVYDTNRKDDDGNVILKDSDKGEILSYDAHNNLICSNNRLIALVGVENLAVVDTEDAILIMPQSRSQDVKKIVEQLKSEKKKEYL